MMPKYNLDQVSDMEEELLRLQKIEIGIKSPDGKISKTVEEYTATPAFYTNSVILDEFIEEINGIIEEIAKRGGARGRIMSERTMARFLENQERINRTQRTLDIIDRANQKYAARRVELYLIEAQKEYNILKSDIEIFRRRAQLAGLTAKDTLKQLVRMGSDKTGFVQSFSKRTQSLGAAVVRRENAQAAIDNYKRMVKPGEEWQWITISVNPCPDCQIRAGVVLPLSRWEQIGTPGAGTTICGSHCLCNLVPVSIGEDMFPEVKTFAWDKKSGVLTTAGEMRTLGAKSHRPPQKT